MIFKLKLRPKTLNKLKKQSKIDFNVIYQSNFN